MHNITLICTIHKENGLCSVSGLYEILERVRPEVIFLEVSPLFFDAYYKEKSQVNLESNAVNRYIKNYNTILIPVDRYDMSKNQMIEFKNELDCAFDYVEQASQEYQELMENDYDCTHNHGFKYLNSDACATTRARTNDIEDKMIIGTGNQNWINVLKQWRHFIQQRDFVMISNIYEYCREHDFDTGVFLVGAAHKSGIVMGIEKYAGTEVGQINWNLTYGY